MSQDSDESLEQWLHDLEWSQLLSLQRQLVSEMNRRYVEITRPVKENLEDALNEFDKPTDISSYDDLPSTQYDPINVKKNLSDKMKESRKGLIKQEHVTNGRGERSPELRRNVELLSSPLKDNDIIIDSQASDILKENDVNVQGSQRLGYGKVKRVRSPKKTTIWSQYSNKIEKENVKRAKVLVDFNVNPLTKKPWIFEDFKINESIPSKNRGRSGKNSNRVARFHAQAGSPVKDKQKIVLNSDGLLETVDDIGLRHPNVPDLQYPDDSFENLRDRSKSPPGYGRLNFPTTQERIEDKEESKKLLFKKTKERFLQATNNSIPISDREYYFRNAKLNDIVDDGTFAWNDSELNIFTR